MVHENIFTKKLKISYPIIQAGMAGGVTTPELVASVSNAGALGTLGAGYLTEEQTRKAIRNIKQLTNKPFAVNLFVPEKPSVSQTELDNANNLLQPIREELGIKEIPQLSEQANNHFTKQVKIIIEENVPVCSFTFGIPNEESINLLKKANITVIGTATTVKEAILNEEAGMDMVVVQGSEAGGHRGTFLDTVEKSMIGTMALVPQAADQVRIPIIAAGGIMDGRGVIAALTLGAHAVQMGTAFLTAIESGAHPLHKQAVLKTTEDETVLTKAISGKAARGINNEFIKQLEMHEEKLPPYPIQNTLTQAIRKEAAKQQRPEYLSLWSGQNPRTSTNQSVSKLIQSVISQMDEIVKAIKVS